MAGMLSAALGYTARGWIVHRIHPPTAHVKSPGKQPIDTKWQKVTEPPTNDKLGEWFENDTIHNIGLQCGERSDVTVIDLDSMAYADIFNDVDTLRSSRTAGRAHVYFRYNPRLEASKHHNLGIEVLASGNNAILPPSIHISGGTYQWSDPDADLMEMPEEIEVKLNNLFERERGLNKLIRSCRPCLAKLWKKEIRETTDFHGAEGRELVRAWGTDLKAAGATLADCEMWARVLYGDGYDPVATMTEWRGLDTAKTWKCATIAEKLGTAMTCNCDTCVWHPPAQPRQRAHVAAMAPVSPEIPTDKSDVLNALGASLEKKLDTFDIIEALQKENPIIYDTTRQFWIWSKNRKMYLPVDETDVLNMLKNVMGVRGGVIGAAKATYLQAIKLTGREVEVKEPDKNWVAFRDCVIDIQTGERFVATPEYMFTNTIPHNYGDSEDTPTLDRLFMEWVGEATVPVLYEIAAYCLYNGYPIHRAFLLFGSGRNGKGQYTVLLQRWLGMANITSSSLDKLVGSIFQASKLYTKKACFMGETNFGTMNKTDVFKMLTGADLISGERKYGSPFDFYNWAKLIIATNNIPDSDDKTEGFGSRWLIADFRNKFEEGIPVVDTIPEWEYENLCRKSVRILRDLLNHGSFTGEGDITARTKRYEEKSNPIRKFINERCKAGGDLSVPLWTFYEQYEEYQRVNRLRSLTKKAISKWLRNQGYEVEYRNINGRNWAWVFGLDMEVYEVQHELHEIHEFSKTIPPGEKRVQTTCNSCNSCKSNEVPLTSQSDRMKTIDLFFREHKNKNGEPAEISYASQEQLVEFIPDVVKLLHITEDVAFKSVMQYGKDRGWL